MSTPFAGRYYNETLNNRVNAALAQEIRFSLEDAELHPGLPGTGNLMKEHDIATKDLKARPQIWRRPVYADKLYSAVVTDLSAL